MTSREHQIQEMLRSFPSITVLVPGELYSLPLSRPDCSLLIDLPASFPESEAILLVEPVVPHKWILPSGQVRVPSGVGKGMLAGMLKELERELMGSVSGDDGNSFSNGFSNYSTDSLLNEQSNGQVQSNVQTQQAQQIQSNAFAHAHAHGQNAPAITPTFAQAIHQSTLSTPHPNHHQNPSSPVHRQLLDDDRFLIDQLDVEQMEALLRDEGGFEAFLGTLDSFRALDSDVIQAENYKLSEQNLREKAGLDALVKELEEAHEKYQQALTLYQSTLQTESLKKLNLVEIRDALRAELREADKRTQSFLREALAAGTVEANIKEYIRQRKEYHYKSILLQKLSDCK